MQDPMGVLRTSRSGAMSIGRLERTGRCSGAPLSRRGALDKPDISRQTAAFGHRVRLSWFSPYLPALAPARGKHFLLAPPVQGISPTSDSPKMLASTNAGTEAANPRDIRKAIVDVVA